MLEILAGSGPVRFARDGHCFTHSVMARRAALCISAVRSSAEADRVERADDGHVGSWTPGRLVRDLRVRDIAVPWSSPPTRDWAIAQAGSLASKARFFGNGLVEAVRYS